LHPFSFGSALLPEITFSNGVFTGLSYLVANDNLQFGFDNGSGDGTAGTVFSYEQGAVGAITDSGRGTLTLAPMPEPATILGILLVGGLGLRLRK
jgi:hypothetical protein